jgi:soluble lytic murein transglycosylase-like protein
MKQKLITFLQYFFAVNIISCVFYFNTCEYVEARPGLKKSQNALSIIIKKAAQKHKLEPELLSCLIFTESSYRVNSVSNTGDYGLGQINIRTWKHFDKQQLLSNERYSANAAAEILSFYQQLLRPDNSRTWVCGYNLGPDYHKHGGVCEDYLAKINSCIKAGNYL